MVESELGKYLVMLKDASFSGLFLAAIWGVIARKWVPAVYYFELQAYNVKLQSSLDLAHDAADRSTRVTEETLRMFRDSQGACKELQTALVERVR